MANTFSQTNCQIPPSTNTVKHLIFVSTLFSHKFANPRDSRNLNGRENLVPVLSFPTILKMLLGEDACRYVSEMSEWSPFFEIKFYLSLNPTFYSNQPGESPVHWLLSQEMAYRNANPLWFASVCASLSTGWHWTSQVPDSEMGTIHEVPDRNNLCLFVLQSTH